MSASVIVAGLGLAAVGFIGRQVIRKMPEFTKTVNEAMKTMPKFNVENMANAKYYKGGFDPAMNRREASLILGVSPTASKPKIQEAFKRVMGANHPDRGGSPYLAIKISEANNFLTKRS